MNPQGGSNTDPPRRDSTRSLGGSAVDHDDGGLLAFPIGRPAHGMVGIEELEARQPLVRSGLLERAQHFLRVLEEHIDGVESCGPSLIAARIAGQHAGGLLVAMSAFQ